LCGLIRYYTKNLTLRLNNFFNYIKVLKQQQKLTGVAWLSETRAVKCFVNSINE
jgi:hypothetical protein